jgi:hypothetical protein
MPRAQFHLRHAEPSIRTEGSPAVLAMTGHEPRRSIHHHSLLSAVGREVQLDVVHTGGCDALPGGAGALLRRCRRRQPGRTARPSPPLRAWKCQGRSPHRALVHLTAVGRRRATPDRLGRGAPRWSRRTAGIAEARPFPRSPDSASRAGCLIGYLPIASSPSTKLAFSAPRPAG